ncbi:MAG: peptidoglycan DD-metalloendopeptidase family protein [SAR324 cluster bacterium]|nr:peptidoglycan DD-metalloendopeptidase family protein [SAR324 cluster bacterium]
MKEYKININKFLNRKYITKSIFLGLVGLMIGFISSCSNHKSYSPAIEQGHIYIWRSGDSLASVARFYEASVSEIKRHNNIFDEQDIANGKMIFIAKSSPARYSNDHNTAVAAATTATTTTTATTINPNSRPAPQAMNLVWPLKGRVTSPFGMRGDRMHDGIDIVAKVNSPIVAVEAGKITQVKWIRGYGKTLIIDHGGGVSSLYAHLNKALVRKGQQVKQSQPVALVGRTGNATAHLLHFEVRLQDKPVNPAHHLPNFNLH